MNNLKKRKRLFVIAGPTAVGKTELALKLARIFEGDIVSADAFQVYKYLDIGTAKPSPEELGDIRYHLIDLVEPSEQFNVAEFIKRADEKISEIYSKRRIPLVVGGSGMYIKSLIEGIFEEPSKDIHVRKKLKDRLQTEGIESLYREIEDIDPDAASRIAPSDRIRILRVLEVFYVTGKPISRLQEESRKQGTRYDARLVVLTRDRRELFERINERVEKMFQEGFIEEVKRLLDMGYSADDPGLHALGYREIIAYLNNKKSLEETKSSIKRDTRRYAKRQITWFKGMKDGVWINLSSGADEQILKSMGQLFIATFGD